MIYDTELNFSDLMIDAGNGKDSWVSFAQEMINFTRCNSQQEFPNDYITKFTVHKSVWLYGLFIVEKQSIHLLSTDWSCLHLVFEGR